MLAGQRQIQNIRVNHQFMINSKATETFIFLRVTSRE